MNNKDKTVLLELASGEATTLTTHLTEFLSGSHGRIQRLTNRKYDLLDVILFAKFGFKFSVTLGFQKLKPYFTNNHWRIVKDITEIDFKIKKMEYSNLYLDKINQQVHHLTNMDNYTFYEPYQVHDDLKWRQLVEKYTELGTIQTEDELRNIISEMGEASGNR